MCTRVQRNVSARQRHCAQGTNIGPSQWNSERAHFLVVIQRKLSRMRSARRQLGDKMMPNCPLRGGLWGSPGLMLCVCVCVCVCRECCVLRSGRAAYAQRSTEMSRIRNELGCRVGFRSVADGENGTVPHSRSRAVSIHVQCPQPNAEKANKILSGSRGASRKVVDSGNSVSVELC